nr:cyclophilin-like fold protein [Neobacillus sp. Marseille-Q6967]
MLRKGCKWILLFILATSTFLTACGDNKNENNVRTDVNLNTNQVPTDKSNNETSQGSTGSNTAGDVRIKITFNHEEVIVEMFDNPTSRDFLTLLPLTITLEDYARTEKIHYLSKELSTVEAPSGSDPLVGDFSYYSPWGNLVIYYKDFGYSNGLIKLGKIESGIEKFENIPGDIPVTIEKIN